MSNDDKILNMLLNKLTDIEKEQRKISETVLKTIVALKYNTDRTNKIEEMIKPLHEESIKRKANKEMVKYFLRKGSFILGLLSVASGIIFGIVGLIK